MRKHSLLFLASGLLGCLLTLQSAVVRADPIPNISITAATGEAMWGSPPSTSSASLSGTDFSLQFSGFFPSPFDLAFPGQAFSPILPLHEVVGSAEIPRGTLTVAGVTNFVSYPGLDVVTLANAVVPSGSATLVLPGALTGSGTVCIIGPFPDCLGTPTIPPVFIANVAFDIPGSIRFDFTSAGVGGVETERFTATFTPVPEPVTGVLVLTGLAVAVVWRIRGAKRT